MDESQLDPSNSREGNRASPLHPSTNLETMPVGWTDGGMPREGWRFLKRAPTASPPGKKPRVRDGIVQQTDFASEAVDADGNVA